MHRLIAMAIALSVTTAPALAQTEKGKDAENQATQSQDMSTEKTGMNFAANAAQNGAAEITLSSLALQKSDDQRVLDFSEMMIQHHSSAMVDLMKVLNDGDMTVPVMPGADQMQAIERLQGLSGEEFNEAYFEHQVEAHQKAITLYESGAESGQSEELQRYARMKLPLLRAHLELAQGNAGGNAN